MRFTLCRVGKIVALLVSVLAAPAIAQEFHLDWVKDEKTFPGTKGSTTRTQINAALARVKGRFDRLFDNDVGYALIRIRFESLGATGNPGGTSGQRKETNYSFARGKLIELTANDGEPQQEQDFYDALPQGPTINSTFANNTPTAVTKIQAAKSLYYSKWAAASLQESATITINKDKTWDYWSKNGVAANSLDFENTVTHEVMHALGIFSELESTSDDAISVWDIFRFLIPSPPNGITAQVFTSASRMLQPGAVAVSQTVRFGGAAFMYRMSTGDVQFGDGHQASHWLISSSSPTGRIGIMDPVLGAGEDFSDPYLLPSDIRALDTVGWNVDSGTPPANPAPNQQNQPTNGQSHSSLHPTFEWTPQGGATAHDLIVWRGGDPEDLAYVAEDLTATSHTIPFGVLDESTQYTWRVNATNAMGWTYSQDWTFTTRCYADCNADGTLNLSDFGCYQTKFALGDPEADCNEDGILNLSDFGCFQTRYALGCP